MKVKFDCISLQNPLEILTQMTLVSILGYIAVASVAYDSNFSNSFKMCRSAMLEQYLLSKIAKCILYYTNIRVFKFSTVLNKLPDHHNLPFFDDILHFWYQSRVSLFVLLGFFVSIKTISFDIKLN